MTTFGKTGNEDRVELGKNIQEARLELGLTQEQLAEKMEVSFQAVSSWERDEYLPDTAKLQRLAKVLEIPLAQLFNGKPKFFKAPEKVFYDITHMQTRIKATAQAKGMTDTLAALDFATAAHEGQPRKNSDIPYISHPLTMACHAFALGIDDDAIIAACLMHDTIEDCKKTVDDIPGSEETKQLVVLMTCGKENDPEKRPAVLRPYYAGLASNPKAALIKLLDRFNNLSSMSWGLTEERQLRFVNETEEYVYPLFDVVAKVPAFSNAAFLLKYDIKASVNEYKWLACGEKTK